MFSKKSFLIDQSKRTARQVPMTSLKVIEIINCIVSIYFLRRHLAYGPIVKAKLAKI